MNKIEPKFNLQKDLNYIKNDIIAKQHNGNYCKFSKLLDAISISDFTLEYYLKYWTSSSKSRKLTEEDIAQIELTILEKFMNGLTDKDTMINLIKNSSDCEKEKTKYLNLMIGV